MRIQGTGAKPKATAQTALLTRAFIADSGGSVAIMFALSIFLLFGFVGGAIDFVRIYRARSMFQTNLDAAVLAAARAKQLGATDSDSLQTAQNYIAPVQLKLGMTGPVSFDITNAGTTITATAMLQQPTMFLRVIGMDKLAFKAGGVATFGNGTAGNTNVELAVMLDITGSMSGQKIDDLKASAQDLVDIVVADDQSHATSRVALVPFSIAVKVEKDLFEAATGQKFTGAFKGCVVERSGVDAYTDATPTAGSFAVPLENVAGGAPCDGGREVTQLTDNKGHLKGKIASLTAGGSTAGHIGTAWAWYMLSPKWAAALDSKSEPGPYSDLTTMNADGTPKLKKIAVLMTDGAYNTQYGPTDSTTQARAICAEMKKTGVIVYTVGFDLGGDTVAIETLSGCASDASKFYNATTGDALRAAFRDIALKASPLRLSQ